MAGQGSLRQQILRCVGTRPPTWTGCALVATIILSSFSALHAAPVDETVDVRLRYQWQAKEARFWNVRLTVTDPDSRSTRISDVENHSTSDQTSGAPSLSRNEQSLTFQPRHAVRDGAVVFRIRASRNAKLTLQLIESASKETRGETQTQEVALSEFLTRGAMQSDANNSGSGESSWSLSRVYGDELRIQNSADIPLYKPGSTLDLAIRANSLMRCASRSMTLRYSLERLGYNESVSTHRWQIKVDAQGNSEPIQLNEPVPSDPGVYEIRCEIVEDDDNIWSRLRRREPPIVRVGRPIAVVSDTPGLADSGANWEVVGQIRPSESSWSVGEWLPKQTTRFIPGTNSHSTGDLDSQSYAGETISLIQPETTFQATLPVMVPGLPHQVTIRFPVSHTTRLRVDVAPTDGKATPADSFVLHGTQSTKPGDAWQTHTFVYYPTGDDQIWLTNLDASRSAGFESISVMAGPSHLVAPTADAIDRKRSAVLRMPNLDWVSDLSHDVDKQPGIKKCDSATQAMYRLWIATDRLCDYARATGMSGIMVPANSGAHMWFDSDELYALRDVTQHDPDRLATFLKFMEGADLDVYVDLHPDFLLSGPEHALGLRPSLANALVRGGGNGEQYNILHPTVQHSLASLVQDLDRQCQTSSCFAGLAIRCDGNSHLGPIRHPSNDSGALTRFAQYKGMSTNLVLLRTWVKQSGKPEFESWLNRETANVHQMIAEAATAERLLMLGLPGARHNDADETATINQPSRSERMMSATSFRYGPSRVLAKRSALTQKLSAVPTPNRTSHLAAVLGREAPRQQDEPPEIHPSTLGDISRIVDRLDPELLVIESPVLAGGLSAPLATMLQSYASIPVANMDSIKPVDPSMQSIRIISGTHQGFTYVTIISLAPWSSEVSIETSKPIDWVAARKPNAAEEDTGVEKLSAERSKIVVPAGETVVLRSRLETDSARITSWSTRVAGGAEALEDIKRQVTLISERIGILSDFEDYGVLTNGGFEQSGGMGLVGWLHAQHPPGCVQIDNKESFEGNHSVMLTTNPTVAARTWIVSETIDPPPTGRLAVSCACRGELRDDDSMHRLKISIEATRSGEPLRFSREFEVPRNGQWGTREVVLEADGIEGANVDSLRLTIDSLSGGRVWIDDVRLHHQFPTEKERADLQSQALFAVQGLQRGNLTPSGRLLQNHWARHLLTLEPEQQTKRVIEEVEPVAEPPGVAERIRSWLPLPLRF